MLRRAVFAALGTLAMAVAGGGPAHAQYPDKPIKLVIPYRAGGGSDSLARVLQAVIQQHKLMPVPFVIVNATGAGGVVGARRVKNAEPDGYTFLQMHNEMFALAATGRLGFKPLKAYEPVAQLTQACLYLAVPSKSPLKNFDDMVAYAKNHPGKLKLADIIGGIGHFAAVNMMNDLGIKLGIVQTGGTSARFASLEGGHTEMAFMSSGWLKRGGDKLRGLLWMGDKAPAAAKVMPTAKSKNLDVIGCLNRRVWAPAGTPKARVNYFADVLEKAMNTLEIKKYTQKQMSDVRIRTGEILKQDIEKELKSFDAGADIVKASMTKK